MTILILSLTILNLSFAHSGDTLDVRAGTIPVIDGVINAAEWADADSIITDSLPNGQAIFYFKENPDTLYRAVFIPDNSNNNNDRVAVYFDRLNNAGTAPQTDDFGCEVRRTGNMSEYVGTGSLWSSTTVSGWRAVHNATATSWSCEYAISYNKLGVTAGTAKCLGFCITVTNQGTATVTWPHSAQNTVPDTWGDMISTVNWDAGPITSTITISPPNPPQGITEIVVYAIVSDSTTGMSLISAAETFIDSVGSNGTGYAMQAQDGAFDEIIENVFDTITVSGWLAGDTHFVYVHGQDEHSIWGGFDSLMVIITIYSDE